MNFEDRLKELGINLPVATPPVASYVSTVEQDGLLYISGQVSFTEDRVPITGKVGEALDLEFGARAARQCGLSLLAQIKTSLGSLDRVRRIIKLTVYVNSAPNFSDHPKVANGASDLMIDIFGDAGRHARSAVGVAALPLGAAVEIDAIIAVRKA